MLAHDGSSPTSPEELVHALEVPLASVENYLAGVRAHTRSLSRRLVLSDELGDRLSTGINGAIRHLERAAAIISEHGPDNGPSSRTKSQVPAWVGTAIKEDDIEHPDLFDSDDRTGGY